MPTFVIRASKNGKDREVTAFSSEQAEIVRDAWIQHGYENVEIIETTKEKPAPR
jgi:hypothetical protein